MQGDGEWVWRPTNVAGGRGRRESENKKGSGAWLVIGGLGKEKAGGATVLGHGVEGPNTMTTGEGLAGGGRWTKD